MDKLSCFCFLAGGNSCSVDSSAKGISLDPLALMAADTSVICADISEAGAAKAWPAIFEVDPLADPFVFGTVTSSLSGEETFILFGS